MYNIPFGCFQLATTKKKRKGSVKVHTKYSLVCGHGNFFAYTSSLPYSQSLLFFFIHILTIYLYTKTIEQRQFFRYEEKKLKRCMPFDHNNNIAFYFYNSLKSECDDDNYIAMHITFLVVRNNSAYILYVCLKCIFNLKTMKWIDRCLIIILL